MQMTKSPKAGERTQPEETFPVELIARMFGNWSLGYAWVTVTIGDIPVPGLALYASYRCRTPSRRIVGSLKEAMAFMQKNRIPSKSAGKLLARAMDEGNFGGEK